MIGSERISKREWYARGGFANSRCWRRDSPDGWLYFYCHD